jgi:hypothetical protein
MTGEITLRGEVLPIGGLKEKLLAAHRGGIETVIIPLENERDLTEIPKNIKQHLNIHPVRWIDEVLDIALTERPERIGAEADGSDPITVEEETREAPPSPSAIRPHVCIIESGRRRRAHSGRPEVPRPSEHGRDLGRRMCFGSSTLATLRLRKRSVLVAFPACRVAPATPERLSVPQHGATFRRPQHQKAGCPRVDSVLACSAG